MSGPGNGRLADWTEGVSAIVYQRCAACRHLWYFRRGFCPRCGSTCVETLAASGRGTVHAVTLVSRAPTHELAAELPYLVILVDAAEGFRLMAHGEPNLRIGDPVAAGFAELAGRLIPYFRLAR
ncbi:MAG: Zn-ribbon domain-containing OB-fold protein [Alphaproteobacteria bacterium]